MKRLFDFILSLTSLFFLAPVLLLVGIVIKLESKGPMFFIQERVGLNFKPFFIYKFRTMKVAPAKEPLQLVTPGDARITRSGEFLRKTKLDEIPQLFNVLKGEMSFVGPRPELKIFVDHYRSDFEEILKVTPGITDLASLEYKNESDLHKNSENPENDYITQIMPGKIKLAKEYIEKRSFFFDLKLIVKTGNKMIF